MSGSPVGSDGMIVAMPDRPGGTADEQASSMALEFDAVVYPLAAVLRAAYWMDATAGFAITTPSPNRIHVLISPREGVQAQSLPALREAFQSRVLDETVRAQVRAETREIRELILAKAFSAPGLLDDPAPGDDRDPVERVADERSSDKPG